MESLFLAEALLLLFGVTAARTLYDLRAWFAGESSGDREGNEVRDLSSVSGPGVWGFGNCFLDLVRAVLDRSLWLDVVEVEVRDRLGRGELSLSMALVSHSVMM